MGKLDRYIGSSVFMAILAVLGIILGLASLFAFIDEMGSISDSYTVMDVLKANYKVKETNGFITSIDGKQQDEKAGLYWMFKVNGKLASKAANQIKAKDGDKIEFYQKVYSDED